MLTKINLYIKVKFYLGLIQSVLNKGKQILILVPYIKNINPVVFFLKKYFNISIDILHSQLTSTKYLKTWVRTKHGENSIIIGTKKSIFLPFLNLGIIILFEEHNLNYKSMSKCRYNIRDIGILRAHKENIPIILDSDTPSLKTLDNVLSKKYFYIIKNEYDYIIKLKNSIIDLKKEKIKFGLSLTLINEIHKNFKKKQTLLIFNKFSLYFFILSCKTCGLISKCTSCDNYFEINQYHNILFCRFCLIKIKIPSFCYNCGCLSLIILNIGIEKIKNEIQNIFPKIPLFFLLNKKNINKNLFNTKMFKFSISSPYIIITTEEIVQNYYFPHVKFISLICIDNYFLSFQFRAIEYFAQFYVSLSKLTQHSQKSLEVLIQTSFANNLYLKELCKNGYFSFVNKIISSRKKFLLPPFSFQSIVYSESIDSENSIIFLNLVYKILKKKSKKYNIFLWLVGPHYSFLFKNKNKHFYQLLIQCSSRFYLHNLLNECIDTINVCSISKKVKWFIDFEPN